MIVAELQSGNEVQVRASFPPTLAFYIGHNLNPSNVSEYLLLSPLWQTAAEVFCSNKCVTVWMSDKALQSQIAALTPEEVLELDPSQIQKNLTVELLTKLPEAVRPVLLCVRFMRTTAVTQGHQAGLTQDASVDLTLAKLFEVKYGCVPASAAPLPQTPLSRHVALLRSALLVIKAAIVSSEVPGNPPKPYSAKRALWNTVHCISGQVHASAVDASDTLMKAATADSLLAADVEQAQHLYGLLIGLIMPILKHHLKGSLASENQPKEYMPVICCTILDSLLTRTSSPVLQTLSQTSAAEMLKSGQSLTALAARL